MNQPVVHAAPLPSALQPTARLRALDLMRGFVMVLMAIDHASGAFNKGRMFSDAARFYEPGTPLPTAQFLTRFITHLCAPTFVFLAGTSAALSSERRLRTGASAWSIDRHLLARGLLIAALDPLWMNWGFTFGHLVLLQVLYGIGTSMCAMALLRRLPSAAMVGLGLLLAVGCEALAGAILALLHVKDPPLWLAFLLTGGQFGKLVIAYPTLPWLAIMLLGWAYGRFLFGRDRERSARFGERAQPARPERALVIAGLLALGLFLLVRGANGYGNMLLFRDDGSFLQWLHVSKYPPALVYDALELGIMAFLLASFFAVQARDVPGLGILALLGQTAFFFYLLHVHLLEGAAALFGWQGKFGVASAYVGGFAIVAVLYPACVRYLGYKRAHPNGWTRYI